MNFQQQLYDQIRAMVAPQNKKFLLFNVAINWDWAPDANFVHEVEHELVGTMPALVAEGEDPFYVSSGTDIYDAYKTVLESVKVDVTEEQKELDEIDASMETILEQQQKTYAEFLATWKASGLPESEFDQWKMMSGWGLRLSMHMAEVPALQNEKQLLLDSFNASYNSAVEAIKQRDGFAKVIKNGKVEEVPNYIVTDNGITWRTKIAGRKSHMTAIKLSTNTPPVASVSEKRRKFQDDKFLTFSADFSDASEGALPSPISFPLIQSGSISRPKRTVNIESDVTDINITFEAFTMVNVKPDPSWYHAAYLNKVAQSNGWRDGKTTEQVFGPCGFHSVVTGFVAVYRPSFEISTSSKFFNKIKGIVASGGCFTLGPFSFGALAPSSEEMDFSSQISEEEIVIQSEFPYAKIIGVIVQNPCGSMN